MTKPQTRNVPHESIEELHSEDIHSEQVHASGVDANDEWGAAPDDWEEGSTGFPPYWNPGEGKSFRARFLLIDNRDPNFIRYVCINTGKFPLLCATGPAEDAEPVFVQPGEQFTISDYAGLPLVYLLGEESTFMSKEKKKVVSDPKKTVWIWKWKASPKVKQMVMDRKNAMALKAAERMKELASGAPSGSGKPVEAQGQVVS